MIACEQVGVVGEQWLQKVFKLVGNLVERGELAVIAKHEDCAVHPDGSSPETEVHTLS